jgi:hypothetical protein
MINARDDHFMAHAHASFEVQIDRGLVHYFSSFDCGLDVLVEQESYVNWQKDDSGEYVQSGEVSYIAQPIDRNLQANGEYNLFHICRTAEAGFFSLLTSGYAPKDAIGILPQCARSTVVVTGNYNQWKNWLDIILVNALPFNLRLASTKIALAFADTCARVFKPQITKATGLVQNWEEKSKLTGGEE